MKNTHIYTDEEIKAFAWDTLEQFYLDYDIEVAQYGYITLKNMVGKLTEEGEAA